jgi:hypothetical protein
MVKADNPLQSYSGVLFEKIVGKEARLKASDPITHCEVRANDTRLSKDLLDLAQRIKEAQKEPWQEGLHFMAQIPSVEIYAMAVTFDGAKEVKAERILIFRDYQTLKTRVGANSEKLLEVINRLCP